MSRPTASVPSTWGPSSHCGGFNARSRFCAFGSNGASHGASAPATMSVSTMAPPMRIFGLSSGRIASRRRARTGPAASPTATSTATLPSKADPRIDEAIKNVDHEVDGNKRQRIDDDGPSDERIVARLDSGDQQRAAARPREYGFDDDRAAQQGTEFETDHRDHRNERIAQHVAPQHGAFGNAFGPRGADEVFMHHFEHRGAGHPHDNSHHVGAERDRRQDDMLHAVPCGVEIAGEKAGDDVKAGLRAARDAVGAAPGRRQPVQIASDYENQHDAEPEVGHRDAEKPEERAEIVGPGIRLGSGPHAEWQAERDGNEQ